ncbi:hypothetical protein J1N35_028484 [Gossypium stocksii]|uniref:RNase H type-1 domain-containing protein n=1 Tax=Gossypium stocksii TaxID=47602 RepID=A0A9D3UW28_9ROSI|nr:hypothetical protein J1N35_028484 [Gossypium stocksii]
MKELLATKSIIHSNIASPFTAEAHAGLDAVKLGIEMGFQEVQILGNSRTVNKKSQSSTRDYSVIGAVISDIQSKKTCFQKIKFKYIPRRENRKAHDIARESLKNGEIT